MSKFTAGLLVALMLGGAGQANATYIDTLGTTIDTSTGLEWLDLTETLSLPLHVANATFGVHGFRYANDLEIAELLAGFNINYAFTPGTYTPMIAADSDVIYFSSLFGSSRNDSSSLGSYQLVEDGRFAYLCLSIGTCGPRSFTNDVNVSISGNSQTGIFFVREARPPSSTEIPTPVAPALLGVALAALAFTRRPAG
jgi:hypothetical protein